MGDESYIVIVNGAAGGGRCRERAEAALESLRDAGVRVGEVTYTERPGHATELARQAAERGVARLLALGGDGTAFEVVNGLLASGAKELPVVGFLPLGTGNSFLRDFGIHDQAGAMAALRRGKTRKVDVVEVTHRDGTLHYMNLLTIGFISDAGDLANRRFKALGDRGYLVAALACMVRLKYPVEPICVDGEAPDARPSAFLCFSNSQYTGGTVHIAPHADPTDGELDIVRAGPMNKIRFAKNLMRAYQGTHVNDTHVEERRARTVEFLEPREHVVLLDGEIQRLTLERLRVRPGALEVVL